MHTPGDAPDGQEGSVIYSYNNIDTYRFVEPKTAAAASEDKPFVNWKWLGIGLGGVLIMLVIMFVLTRVFRSRAGRGVGRPGTAFQAAAGSPCGSRGRLR